MNRKIQLWVGIALLSAVVISLAIALPIVLSGDDDDTVEGDIFIGRMALDDVPLIDGHNDLPMNLYDHERNQINDFDFEADLTKHPIWGPNQYTYTDLQRLRQGKLGGQFWVAWVDCDQTQYKDAVERTLEQLDVMKRLIEKYPSYMKYTTTAQGILDAFAENKIASMLAVEGGHAIDSRLAILRMYYELGVRYMTLTHSCNVPWADASPIDDTAEVKKHLNDFGKVVVLEMNRLGMMVDLSHVSHGVMSDVLDHTRAPIIFSHSNSFQIHNHHRNVQDDILRRLPANGGIIMVNFYQTFIGGSSMLDVIKHLNHIKSITGPDHIGIGSDYDGIDKPVDGLDDVSKYPELFDMLAEPGRGFTPWTRDELKKLAGLNLIRVFQEVERVRDELKTEKPHEDIIPSDLLLESDEQLCRNDLPSTNVL